MQTWLRVLLGFSASRIANAADFQHPLTLNLEPDGAAFDPAFDAFIKATLHEWHVPGLSIAVIHNGNVTSNVTLAPHVSLHEIVLNNKGLWLR